MTNWQIISVAIILLYTILAVIHSLRGDYLLNKKPKQTKIIKSTLTKNEILSIIVDVCLSTKFTIEQFNIDEGFVLLSEETTLLHSGYFYPLYLSGTEREIQVEVGAKSKWLVKDISFNRHHNQIYSLLSLAFLNKESSNM